MSTLFFLWDIRSEKEREYKDFISNEFLPLLGKLDMSVTDGWLKIAGEGPQMMYLAESDDLETAIQVLGSKELKAIETRLLPYVENYSKHLAHRDIKNENH
ncbi:MAG: hypothetical protein HXX08_21625 [Chloroflexi bacterium]|uniref:Uncharacterized protein n=1 Tax=Candidatus Chlorohelix allophototropha TaxID=3003348 RepID=A0A8T7M8K6_9CHLR|nr:hypothetical protein [Chloroflexota bacterium]WJW68398.1 hypothetical protein OZ401_004009 [Chloroflexota bacterium L227-S17]